MRLRMIILNFFQLFIWGTWLTSLGNYMGKVLHASSTQIGATFGSMGIAALFMPAIIGIIADRWINAERMLAFCHICVAGTMIWAANNHIAVNMITIIFFNAMFYLPTLALNNAICYAILKRQGLNPDDAFPPIRVFGTIGFVIAMWLVDLLGWKASVCQFYLASGASLFLAIYALSLPKVPPAKDVVHKNWTSQIGLDAFVLFKDKRMCVFFVFSLLLGAALQITNTFGGQFLDDFSINPQYKQSFLVVHSGIVLSISQISETLFILTIPFFLKRFGIKVVMIISMLAWFFRFALFAVGNPGGGLPYLLLSMIVYGMAFDFFNISGSLFVEKEVPSKIRSSAQGLFMIMTNGLGAFIGGIGSGFVVSYFTENNIRNWPAIWITFAAYSLVLALTFPFLFKYKEK